MNKKENINNIDLSIITVNWNTRDILLNCIESAYKTIKKHSFEYIVIDNGSTDRSSEAVRSNYPDVIQIINKDNIGFSKASNMGLSAGKGRYLMLLNSDTILTDNAADSLIGFMDDHPEAGAAGGQLLNKDGSRQNSFDISPTLITELSNKSLLRLLFPGRYLNKNLIFDKPAEVDQIIGACIIIRHEVAEQVGLLDERFFIFFEETDWAYRIRKSGWKIFHVPSARIYHLQGQSAIKKLALARTEFFRSRYQYFDKHFGKGKCLVLFYGLMVKLAINLLLNLLGIIITLGCSSAIREKVFVYSHLLWWHLKGCPENVGLKLSNTVNQNN